jgi:hypothetical protein
MNTLLEPGNVSSYYDNTNNYISQGSSIGLIVTALIVVGYYVFSSNLPGSTPEIMTPQSSSGLNLIEILMWAVLLFLLVINGLQYIFKLDIATGIKNIFSGQPEIDIVLTQEKDETTVPEIMLEKQVFHIPDNEYTYEDARAVCKAYGARLATYDEVEQAYNEGGEWCGYGWSENQMALYPTQKKSWETLQKVEGHEHDCGRPGVNGGFIENPNVRFGVNCYGYKPVPTEQETVAMKNIRPYPETKKDKELQKRVDAYRKKLKSIEISPFNKTRWSLI